MPAGSAVFFLSDAHLGAEPVEKEAAREARLHEFLTAAAERATELYVVGDLFDFWFEYRSAIPRRHFATLAALRDLRRAGVQVHYLNGNHDFWLGPFLSGELGLTVHSGAVALERQGRRLWLHHGDGLIGGDLGYRGLKKVVRHPASLRLYQLLHPDVGFPLAHFFSNLSRGSRDRRVLDGDRLWREIAEPRFREGFDTVMIGHFHHVYERREGRRVFVVLGDWIEHFSYAVLEGGELRLETWPDEPRERRGP
jgi:UDP-2,3-diacylglucosamine hydrolase